MKIVNNFEKHFVTYGDNKFNIQKKRLSHQASNFEIFNQIHVYGKKDLSKSFVDKYFKILKNSVGGGYWLWKPYVIQDVLSKTNENDIILYLDAGSTLNIEGKNRLIEYFKMIEVSESSFLRFQIKEKEKYWTSKEVFEELGIEIDSEIGNSNQLAGGIIFIKNNYESKEFFKKFFDIVEKNPNLITDYYQDNQIKDFKSPRHDQSILSILGKSMNSIVLDDETYFVDNPENQFNFPILTVRDNEYSMWQKLKFYSNYFYNINKPIFFKIKPPYYKNISIYKRIRNKLFN